MQHQHQIIRFVSLVTIIHMTTASIDYFGTNLEIAGETIFSNSIYLHALVSDCAPPPCECQVYTKELNSWHPMKFEINSTRGYVEIASLQPYKLYSFTLNCSGFNNTAEHQAKTKVSQPSPPHNITFLLNSARLQISWLPPLEPAGPIDEYRLTIDGKNISSGLPNNQLSYEMLDDYVFGTTHTFTVSACNEDKEDSAIWCSKPDDAKETFKEDDTTTTPPKATASFTFSAYLFLIIFICLLSQK